MFTREGRERERAVDAREREVVDARLRLVAAGPHLVVGEGVDVVHLARLAGDRVQSEVAALPVAVHPLLAAVVVHDDARRELAVPRRHVGVEHVGRFGDVVVDAFNYLTNKVDAPEFSQDDEQVIETLAAYAAVAISNARLYKQLRERDQALTRRNEDLGLLNNLASTLASAPEIDEILDTALTGVVNYLDVEAGEIFLREEDEKTLHLVLHRGAGPAQLWTRERFLVGEGLIGLTARTGQPQIISIPSQNPRFLHRSVHQACIRQIACFPLMGRKGALGVLCIATCHPTPMDELEVQLLSSIGSWTGTAIENVRLNVQGRRLAILEDLEARLSAELPRAAAAVHWLRGPKAPSSTTRDTSQYITPWRLPRT